MAFGALVEDSQGVPISSSYVPGDTFRGVQGSLMTHTDGSNNLSAPVVIGDELQSAILLGKGFLASTGVLATATNNNLVMGMCVFNAAASGKSLYIYSIRWSAPAATTAIKYHLTTANPAYSNSITPTKSMAGGAASSVAAVTSAANGATASIATSGTQQDVFFASAQGTFDLLPHPCGIYLPAGSANGVAVYSTIATAGNSWSASMRWIEF